MTVLDDLLRHQAARQVLRNPDSTQEQRDEARRTLGLPELEHGTRTRYVQGCRCDPCRAENSRYSRRRRDYEAGHLDVNCWCESQVVAVPPSVLAKGLTRSCGRRGCVG